MSRISFENVKFMLSQFNVRVECFVHETLFFWEGDQKELIAHGKICNNEQDECSSILYFKQNASMEVSFVGDEALSLLQTYKEYLININDELLNAPKNLIAN